MTTINMTDPWVMLMALLVNVLFIILGKEFKKSLLPAMALFLFLAIIMLHSIQIFLTEGSAVFLTRCLGYDAIMVFISYISYLWVDDIEAKANNKKSIDNSLEWFWKQV